MDNLENNENMNENIDETNENINEEAIDEAYEKEIEAEKLVEFDGESEGMELSKVEQEYGADEIQVLEGLEAVRKRPGMYIGSTGPRGLHHLVYEIVDNSIDEALAGYCTKIDVVIEKGDIIRVTDNGRGIPVGVNSKTGLPAVTVVFTVLHAGGKFGGGGYKVSGGLHGVGASVVNALSEWLEVKVCDGEDVYFQRYERGKIVTDLQKIGKSDVKGTEVRFKADPEIFKETTVYDYSVLERRLREQAFLNAGVHIELRDERDLENIIQNNFVYEGGIKSFVEYIHKKRSLEVIHPDVIYFASRNADDTIAVEIALQYNESYNENLLTFANNIHTTAAPSISPSHRPCRRSRPSTRTTAACSKTASAVCAQRSAPPGQSITSRPTRSLSRNTARSSPRRASTPSIFPNSTNLPTARVRTWCPASSLSA